MTTATEVEKLKEKVNRRMLENRAVKWFVQEMEKKLHANSHKRGWQKNSLRSLCDRVGDEHNELIGQLFEWEVSGNQSCLENIIKECADIANFAMMIADNAKTILNQQNGDKG